MKKYLLLSILTLSFYGFSANAQEVTKDSISILKQEKETLEIKQRLNENKLKLAKLENQVEGKTDDVNSSAQKAQDAANGNQESAEKLNNNSQDKKLAKEARKDAKRAEKAAKAGRNASGDLSDLQKDIRNLKKKIAEDEDRLTILEPVAIH
jgi:hypothetical protein